MKITVRVRKTQISKISVAGQFKIIIKYDNDIIIRWSWFAFFENENGRGDYESIMNEFFQLQQ
jgi:hypothetical protein